MPSLKTKRTKRTTKTKLSKTRKANSVSPKINLFSKLVKAVALNGDLNAVKRLIKMKVFDHPVDKKTRDNLAKLSIYEILRSRNERETTSS